MLVVFYSFQDSSFTLYNNNIPDVLREKTNKHKISIMFILVSIVTAITAALLDLIVNISRRYFNAMVGRTGVICGTHVP